MKKYRVGSREPKDQIFEIPTEVDRAFPSFLRAEFSDGAL
jgi:hypothetical protein